MAKEPKNMYPIKAIQKFKVLGVLLFFVFKMPLPVASSPEGDGVQWRTPQELVSIGYEESRVVMINEAHSGSKRNIRTRKVGISILETAHKAGVIYLAMEMIDSKFASAANEARNISGLTNEGYLSQPDMKVLVQNALDLGWTLVPYEADLSKIASNPSTIEATNWREERQAMNLTRFLNSQPDDTKLLVWCGNSHHSQIRTDDWIPMGYRFKEKSGIDPFVIHQHKTVEFKLSNELELKRTQTVNEFKAVLAQFGGTAGFLREEGPKQERSDRSSDAFIYSIYNSLE